MNTVSRSKMLVMPLLAGLLLMAFTTHAATSGSPPPSKYTYTATNLSVHFKNSAGQRTSINIQQCGKQELPAKAINANYFEVDNAVSDAFGISQLQIVENCFVTMNSSDTGTFQMSVNVANGYYYFFKTRWRWEPSTS